MTSYKPDSTPASDKLDRAIEAAMIGAAAGVLWRRAAGLRARAATLEESRPGEAHVMRLTARDFEGAAVEVEAMLPASSALPFISRLEGSPSA